MSTFIIHLPDGGKLPVALLHGPIEFDAYVSALKQPSSFPAELKRNYLGFFSQSQQPVVSQPDPSYTLYENGNHLAVYVFRPTAAGLQVEHCAPTNGRAVTPEIRAILEKTLKPECLIDVSRAQRGIYFDQSQDLVHMTQGETEEAFKERAALAGMTQIEQYHKTHQDESKVVHRPVVR